MVELLKNRTDHDSQLHIHGSDQFLPKFCTHYYLEMSAIIEMLKNETEYDLSSDLIFSY